MAKTLIFGYFGYESAKIAKMRFFFENRASSLFSTYLRATSCQKSKRSYGGKYENFCDGRTDRRTSTTTMKHGRKINDEEEETATSETADENVVPEIVAGSSETEVSSSMIQHHSPPRQ